MKGRGELAFFVGKSNGAESGRASSAHCLPRSVQENTRLYQEVSIALHKQISDTHRMLGDRQAERENAIETF